MNSFLSARRRWGAPAVAAIALIAAAPPATSISPERILDHIRVLASDDFEGRGPGTRGEEKTVAYLVNQVKAMGLTPGNPDGSYVQDVPLVGITTKATGTIRFADKSIELSSSDRWVAVSRRLVPEIDVKDSEVVFVGYGVVAPEYGWDDYKGVDVRGKTIVMLVNDPTVPDPSDPAKLDERFFKGRAMTYYGRWTYKYEIAAEKGAAAALIVHETGPAGYPYEVVVGSWGRENFDIPAPDRNMGRPALEAWISTDQAKALFAAAGKDFAALKEAAVHKEFKPVSLGATAGFHARNTLREVRSKNVVAQRVGSDRALKDEYVVYTAHWDHLGRDDSLKSDPIYNGAADNASGVGALLEIARAFTAASPPPKRSILFLIVTAEEKGLLGAKYYAAHPLYPLEKTLANINMDVINLWGRTQDFTVVGLGNSTLDDVVTSVAREQDRTVSPDPEPEKGLFYRSDHFEFAKQGVPALDPKAGTQFLGKPAEFGKQKRDEYVKNDYHKPSDEVKPDWDLRGAAEDAELLFEVGLRVANGDHYPEWKPGTEFRARREAMLKASAPRRAAP